MAKTEVNSSVEVTPVEDSTARSNSSRLRLCLIFAVPLTVAVLVFVYLASPPRYTDEYFLAKIPASLKTNDDITAYLVRRMRQIEHVDGGPMRNWTTTVAPVRHMTSPSPTVDPDLMIARLFVGNRERGIFPALKRVPGIRKLVPRGSASRGNSFPITIIFDPSRDEPFEIVGHDGGLDAFLRDKKIPLKTSEDEEKLWNFLTALNLCHGTPRNAKWLTPEKCEMVLTSAPKFEVIITIDVDKAGFIRDAKLNSR